MTDTWSERAQLMRESPTHRSGVDLDLVVAWCEPGSEVRALDVATGGGHVARRLREAGCETVTVDPAPGMEPDVVAPAEELPFGDGSFDVVACRIAAHHFDDVQQAVRELARVTRDRVVVQDNLYRRRAGRGGRARPRIRATCAATRRTSGAASSRPPASTSRRWHSIRRKLPLEPWIERAIAGPEVAERVRELIADQVGDDGNVREHRDHPQGKEALVAIIVDRETRLVVQGLTGSEGRFHGTRNRDYGTQVVAGVTPGKGGQDVSGIPVFDTVADAVAETGANTTMVFVPARFAADAIYEAVDAGVETVVCIAEGLPAHEMLRVYNYIRPRGITMIGPNCPGALSPGKANVGIIPAEIFSEGSIGLVSRSGTLTYQIGHELTQLGLGNSTIVGIGGDPVVGSSFIDVLARFEADDETEYVVMVGEIGGNEEEKAAEFIETAMTKPVLAYIAGFTAPPGKTMGHAGAIISGSSGPRRARRKRSRRAAFASARRRPRSRTSSPRSRAFAPSRRGARGRHIRARTAAEVSLAGVDTFSRSRRTLSRAAVYPHPTPQPMGGGCARVRV